MVMRIKPWRVMTTLIFILTTMSGGVRMSKEELAPQHDNDERIYMAQLSSSSATDVIDNVYSDRTGLYKTDGRTLHRKLLEVKPDTVEPYFHNGNEEDGSADEDAYHYADDTSISREEFIVDEFEAREINNNIKQDDAHFVNGPDNTFFRYSIAGETDHSSGVHRAGGQDVDEYYDGPEDSVDTGKEFTKGAGKKSVNLTDHWIPAEQRLMYDLLWSYERAVRPVANASATVHVDLDLTVTQIFDMDEKNQVLVTNVWLKQEWNDEFLTWDPDDYEGLTTLRIPCSKIWLPDVVLYNNVARYADDPMSAKVRISATGTVFWTVPWKLQSACKIDATYFPFDEQVCRLKFGSWTYDGFQVDVSNGSSAVDLSIYVDNGEWLLKDTAVRRNVVRYQCCLEPYPDVTFTIRIKRRSIFYLYNIISPCLMMSTLTLLGFCLPPGCGEKISLSLTVLLAFCVFLLNTGEILPDSSEFIPILSVYLTMVMGMTSLSIVLTVIVLNLHYRGSPAVKPPPAFCTPSQRNNCTTFRDSGRSHKDSPVGTTAVNHDDDALTPDSLMVKLKCELARPASPNDCDGDRRHVTCIAYQPESVESELPFLSGRGRESTTDEIVAALKRIISRYERDCDGAERERAVKEWRHLARNVDKFLFWVFLCAHVAVTVFVLVVLPITKPI